MTEPRPPMPDPEHTKDKLALFVLAGLVVIVLGAMVVGVFVSGVVPDKGDVLLGGVATGLILFLRDLVQAVRSSWEEVTRNKTIETVAQSSPSGETVPVEVVNDAGKPVPVEETKS